MRNFLQNRKGVNMTGDTEIIIQVIISGLLMGGIYALVAIGLSLIWGVTDIVHFGHGDFMMLAMYGAYFMWSYLNIDPLFSLPLIMALLFGLGVLTYKLLISKTLSAGSIPQLFSTFGLLVFLESGAQFLWTPDFRMIENPIIGGKIAIGGIFLGTAQLIAFIVAIVAFVVLNWFIKKTDWGLALQAVSENREWAALMGINSEAMFKLSWGVGSACVALAGVLLTNFFYIFPQVGLSFLMIAFVIVALGGFGSLYGTLIAAMLIGLIESVGGYFIGAQYKLVLIFGLYLAVVTFRPKGLFGHF